MQVSIPSAFTPLPISMTGPMSRVFGDLSRRLAQDAAAEEYDQRGDVVR
jgi:hypothetical protein